MNTYRVYIELYGKKMRKDVEVYSEMEAEDQVREDIIFHKTELIKKGDPRPKREPLDYENPFGDLMKQIGMEK